MMDSLEERLAKERRKRALRNFTIFIVIMFILGVINSYILIALSVILMLAGLSAMYEIGVVMDALWGKHVEKKRTIEEKAVFEQSFYEGLLMCGGGLGLLMLTFYLMSMGWYGIIHF
ncbi:MAG: hypothetical protein GXO25_04975 [Euryarchaeota archaeon]|nr:hypothetical protein [Euryarchaeota archaeon]